MVHPLPVIFLSVQFLLATTSTQKTTQTAQCEQQHETANPGIMTVPAKATVDGVAKPRILCLHGKYQSASAFYNKIAGARRKLSRFYELDFLDGPIELEQDRRETSGDEAERVGGRGGLPVPRAWWLRNDDDGRHVRVREAFEYVMEKTRGRTYNAILGFSQGGTLATALTFSGALPSVRAVVTAGAPLVDEAFNVASDLSGKDGNNDGASSSADARRIRKLHIAGERDHLVAMESTRALCKRGGNGEVVVHEQGHLFPTRAAMVNRVVEFLSQALEENECGL